MQRTSNSHVAAIVTKPQWLEAVNKWHNEGGWSCAPAQCSFGLPPDSWRALQLHLLGSGLFERLGDKLKPTSEGQVFLARTNELHRAIERETKQDLIVTQTLDSIPRGPAVDIGCGPGHSVLRLARLGYAPLYAYDLSPIGLEIARAVLEKEGKTAHLFAKDATSLPDIKDSELTLVYSRSALQYLNGVAFAQALKRTLRPGGYLVVELVSLRYYLSYYLRLLTERDLLSRSGAWRLLSYGRTMLRTLVYELTGLQPFLGAQAPEIGWTNRSVRRFARWVGVEILSVSPAPALVGYFVVMRKPPENVN